MGIAEKLCGFLMLVPSAYMQSMSAFVAQNMGAEKPERARKALWCGIASSLVVGVFMAYLTFFHGTQLSGLFAKEPDVILASADYLKAYTIDCMLTPFLFCFIGYFNGCSKTTFVMLQGIAGAFGVRIPVSWLMSRQAEVSLFRIGLATPASSVVQITLCIIYFCFCCAHKSIWQTVIQRHYRFPAVKSPSGLLFLLLELSGTSKNFLQEDASVVFATEGLQYPLLS